MQKNDSNKTKTRRDFLTSGIAGIAGSTLLAEQFAKGATIAGSSPTGLARAISQSPADSAQGTQEGGTKSSGKLYGLMADAGRMPEDPSYYRRALDFFRDWNMNAFLISLADDQGSALKFKNHPEIIPHKNALTHEQAQELADYEHPRGVELLPVL